MEIGTVAEQFLFGNICFQFSLLVLYIVGWEDSEQIGFEISQGGILHEVTNKYFVANVA